MSDWRDTFNEPGEVLEAERIGVATTAPELRRMYREEKMSMGAIAEELGASMTTISRFMDRAGIERREKPDYYEDRNYRDEEWLREEFVGEGRSTTEIADECDVTRHTIRNWVNEFNLQEELPTKCDFHLSGYSATVGYPTWSATGRGGPGHFLVHRLVAIAHGADPHELFGDDNIQIHHRNGFKCDNRPSNLEVIDAKTHGRHHTPDTVQWTDDDLEFVVRFMMNPGEYSD
jgi:transposase-like protein